MFQSKTTKLIVGEFSSGSSLRDFVHGISANGKVFSEMGPKIIKLIRMEYSFGKDPVKNCRK